MNKNTIRAIFVGGLMIALLSTIPVLSFLWFIWAFLGAMLAMKVYRSGEARQIQPSSGLIVGLGAGIIGGVICFVLAPVMQILSLMVFSMVDKPNRSFSKHWGAALEFYFEKVAVFQIPVSLVCSLIIVALAVGGGYFGWMIFCKKNDGAASSVAPHPA